MGKKECKTISFLEEVLSSAIVIATKKHTEYDQDLKEGLRVNRSAFTGNTVLHTDRSQILNSLYVSQSLLKSQNLNIARYLTIEELEDEFRLRLERGEDIRINWIFPSTISKEMERLAEIHREYLAKAPGSSNKLILSHDQNAFRTLDSKSIFAKAKLILDDFCNNRTSCYQPAKEIKFTIDCLLASGFLLEEVKDILSLARDLLPESKECNPKNFYDFILAVIEEYIGADGFFAKSGKFVSKVNHTAGGLGVITWDETFFKEILMNFSIAQGNTVSLKQSLHKLAPKFVEYIESRLKLPSLTGIDAIEDFIVKNGVAFQEYLSDASGKRNEKSINFLQVPRGLLEINKNRFFPIICSDQIIVEGIHLGNVIQVNEPKSDILERLFLNTNVSGKTHLIAPAYMALVSLLLSIESVRTESTVLKEHSDFDAIPILYSGIDLIEKESFGKKEVKLTEINPRFTGCIQPLARVLQEARSQDSTLYDFTRKKKIVSLNQRFNINVISIETLSNEEVRINITEKLIRFFRESFCQENIMLISFQTEPASSRVSYCYLVEESRSMEEILVDAHLQGEVIYNFSI